MTTGGISETGIQSHLISQQMSDLKQQNQVKPDKGRETSIETKDTVNLTAGIWEKELADIDSIDEENARILSQLVARNLANQPFGMSTQAGTEALRAFV